MSAFKKRNEQSEYEFYIECCETLGITDARKKLEQMLVLDYLIVNEDRHLNNFGLIRNAVTLEWIGTAPLYDNGNLIGAVIGGKMRIGKQSLIGHFTSPETVRRVGTEQLRKLLAGYKKAEK